eukprot:Clim_evm8s171 gene=Clim_evmTU8s171
MRVRMGKLILLLYPLLLFLFLFSRSGYEQSPGSTSAPSHPWNRTKGKAKDIQDSTYVTPPARILTPQDQGLGSIDPDAEYARVVICSDKNNIGGMVALMNSILTNASKPSNVFFYLVVSADALYHADYYISKYFDRDQTILRVFPDEWVKGRVKIRGGRKKLAAPLNYARFYIPKLFRTLRSGRVIFIDDDCIVQGDIFELLHQPIDHGHVLTVSADCVGGGNLVQHYVNFRSDMVKAYAKEVGGDRLNPNGCAFNAGVFVADMDRWMMEGITDQLDFWMYANTQHKIYGMGPAGGGSQPPMLLTLGGKFTELDPKWHKRGLGWDGRLDPEQLRKEAKLLHWTGSGKPWSRGGKHRDLWMRYYLEDPTGQWVVESTEEPTYKYVDANGKEVRAP